VDERDVLIQHLLAQVRELTALVASLRAENQTLREEIHRLKKDSSNSSKPPSSDIVTPPKPAPVQRGRRKIGGQPGHAKHERTPFPPERIDQTQVYELSKMDAAGLKRLDEWHVVQQVDLKERPLWIVEHRARKYLNPATGQIVIPPLPPQVASGGLIGPRLSALMAYQKSACHMSYDTIRTFLADVLGLPLSVGHVAKVVQKASAALAHPYEELRGALTKQAHLGIDETGHPERGKNLWTWCFRAETFTVFAIDRSRGSQVLDTVLGKTFGGVIGCDYFSAYRAYMADTGATIQFCLAHLIREVRFLAEHINPFVSRWAEKLLGWLRKLFQTLHRRTTLTEIGFARSMDRIRRRFVKAAGKPPPHSDAAPLARRFENKTTAHAYFTFLTIPGVPPTNNLTEQAIRHVVIDRRITQGTRSERGRRWSERAWTLLATCSQQGRSAFDFLGQALLAHFTHQPTPSLLT
jgi:transposase